MKKRIIIGYSTVLIAAAAYFGTTPLLGDLYWDSNGADAGFGTAGGTWGDGVNWSTNALGATTPDQPANTTASNVLHFGTATTGLGAGTIDINGTQSFDSVSFGVASGSITITNGMLGLATPFSTVRLNSITNTIASTLASGGSLKVRSIRPLICDGFPTTVERILFANATLADYTGAVSKLGGSGIAGGATTPTPATVYHWVNDGTNASFQVQVYEGGHTKVVKIVLRQVGADIAGQAIYAKHCLPDGNILGADFDFEGETRPVATWFNKQGYGATELKLLPYDDRFTQHRFREFLSTNAMTIATGVTLAEFSTAECFMAGGTVDDDVQPASTFYFVNDGTTATFQVQCIEGIYLKCVKVELTQVGSDIQARLLYAKYISGNNPGHNFDVSGSLRPSIATGFDSPNYGIRSIRLNSATSILELTGESAYEGLIDVAASTLKLSGLLGNGSSSGNIINNGAVVCQPCATQRFSGNISGTGSLTVNGFPSSRIVYNTTLTKTPTVIAENMTLAHYGSASGIFSGAGFASGVSLVANPYFFTNNGTNATVQLQVYEGGHTKVSKVEFTQNGANIEAKVVYSKHCGPTTHENNLGADYDFTGVDRGSTPYPVTQISLLPVAVVLQGSNTYSGGTIINSGELEVTTNSGLPALGGIVVNGGNLLLNVPLGNISSVIGDMNNPITVFAGGTLTLAGNFNAGYNRPICIDGGTVHVTAGQAAYSYNFINNLKLMNGAQITGNPIQLGYVSSATLVVSGTSPSAIHSGICLSGGSITLDVADVTNDGNADLKITGVVNDMNPTVANNVIKSGAGTVSFSKSGNTHTGVITVENGAVALDADNTMNAGNSFVLGGGKLEMGATTNTVGTLKINSAGGTLVLGTGKLSFANSSTTAWSGTLSLANTLADRSVRFGSDGSGLTATQLSAIDYNGGTSVRLDSSGYLTATPAGTIIILR